MGDFQKIFAGTVAVEQAFKQSLPPLPTMTPPQVGVGDPDSGLRRAFKVAIAPLTMTVEGLTRFEDTFQAAVLTAAGRIPRDQFDNWVGDIWHGRKRIDGETFSQLAGWSAFRDTLDRLSVIPGWVKQVAGPEGYMTKKPRLTWGNVFDFTIESVISPYSALSMAPRALVEATKIGKLMDLTMLPVTAPLRLAGKAIFSKDTPWGAFLFRLRDPTAAMARFPDLVKRLILDSKSLEDASTVWRPKLTEIYRRHRIGVTFTDWLRGYKVDPEIRSHAIWDALNTGNRAVLRPKENAVVDDIVNEILVPIKNKLAQTGDDVLHLRRGVATSRISPFAGRTTLIQPGGGRVVQAGEAVVKQKIRPGRTVTWDPRRDLLKPFTLQPKNFIREASTMGDKSLEERTNTWLAWKAKGVPEVFDPRRLKDEQKDPFHALDFFVMQAERRHVLYRPGGLFDPKTGFRPTAEFGKPGQNPRLLGMDDVEFRYWMEKVHSITGNYMRKPDIVLQRVGDRFWGGIQDVIQSIDRQKRIRGLFPWLDNPRLGRPTNITSILVARQMQAFLGLSLSGSLKNSSQLLNEGAISGVPAVWRGLYRSVFWGSEEGRIMKDARKMAAFGNETAKLAHDSVWIGAGGPMDKLIMSPFNTSENIVRGISHNVLVGDMLERRGIKTLAQWEALDPKIKQQIVDAGFLHAIKTNFAYGMAGRSALMMHPLARVGTALQSYTWKELEFAAHLFQTDGLAFTRLLALHGWAIESLYHGAGINAENWLGWGFLPPQGRFQSPAIETVGNLTGMLYAWAGNDDKSLAQYTDKIRGNVREVFRMFGDPDEHTGLQAGLAAVAQFGLLPIPLIAATKTAKLYNEFLTGKSEGAMGESWRPIPKEEALTSYFFQTHAAAEASRLRAAEASIRVQFDGVMRKRTREFVKALEGHNGDAVADAAAKFYEGIGVRVPLTGNRFMPGAFIGDERTVHPTPQMVEDRIREEMKRKTVPAGTRELVDSGWTSQVLWAEYARAALRDLEAGRMRWQGK